MIYHEINNKLKVIYTRDKQADLNVVLKQLNYLNKFNQPLDDVNISQGSYYTPQSSISNIPSIKIEKDGDVTHLINDTYNFDYNINNINGLIDKLAYFGRKYSIKIGDKKFTGEFYKNSDKSIKNSSGEVLRFDDGGDTEITQKVYNFINMMKVNNARMIFPLVQKYADILRMMGKKAGMVNGYANILNYLKLMKNPSRSALIEILKESNTEYIKTSKITSRIDLSVKDVSNGIVQMDVHIDRKPAAFETSKQKKLEPFILLTGKPIRIQNQNFRNFVAKVGKIPVFVTPIMFNSSKILSDMRGGVDLLK